LYEAGNLAAAILELQRAHELRPSPKILLTIAEVAEELHDYATALRAYKQFLDSSHDNDTDERKRSLDRLTELKSLVAYLRFHTTPPDARVTVDGDPVPTSSTELWLINVGRRQVLVEKTGYLSHREELTATVGETITLRVSLTKVPKPEEHDAPIPPTSPVVTEEGQGLAPLAWTGFATAGGLLAAGAVTGILALRADDQARNKPFAGNSPPPSIREDLDKANSLALATDVLMGAALGVTLVTAYFAWWAPSEEDGAPGALTRLRVGPTGATVEGLF
jgi:hypothetical protein